MPAPIDVDNILFIIGIVYYLLPILDYILKTILI